MATAVARLLEDCMTDRAGQPEPEVYLAQTAQEVDGCVRRDPGEPVGGLLQVVELVLSLEGFDKGFLGEVLGVVDVANDPVNEQEDAP